MSNMLVLCKIIEILKYLDVKMISRMNAFFFKLQPEVLGFVPKVFVVEESKLSCSPFRKFAINRYSCFVINNISNILLTFVIIFGFKMVIFMILKFMPSGKYKRIMSEFNQKFGVYTFFLFFSGFSINLLIPSLLDIRHTIDE